MVQKRVLVEVTGVHHNKVEGFPPYFVNLSDATGQTQSIYIGEYEAHAIAYALAHQSLERPMTHDLLVTCLAQADAVIAEVTITEAQGETYRALLTMRIRDQVHEVDARPSDAVATALRANCPIFVSEGIFQTFRPYPPQSPATSSPLYTKPSVARPNNALHLTPPPPLPQRRRSALRAVPQVSFTVRWHGEGGSFA